MSTLITVDQVPVADRTEFFRQMTAATWVPMDCRPPGRWDGYRGEFRASGFGPMQVVVMDIMPITVRRTPKLISQADPDLLKVFLVCGGGGAAIGQGGRRALLAPAEFAFYDTRRPYEVVCGADGRPTRVMTFMFPPSLLPLSRGRVRDLTAVRIPATTGLGDLTSQFLLHLARTIDHLSPAEAARVSTAALEVLATRLARELDAADWGTPEARRHALLTTVQGFIQQHLGDAGLSPADIAGALAAFNLAGRDPVQVAEGLNAVGVESRAGCHCATLAHRALGLTPPASCRLSFYLYNTLDEVDAAVAAVAAIARGAPRRRAG